MFDLSVITLRNNQGMEVDILNFGARVSSIRFPVQGVLTEMTMTYDEVEKFTTDAFYIGATCGRFANRIAGGKFSLNGEDYQLNQNSDGNCLHGGESNFANRYWQVEYQNKQSVVLTLTSLDGDQGFPGNLNVKVKYTLTADNALDFEYSARSDQDTTVNLCNHCYFTLGEPDIHSLSLIINSDYVLPVDEKLIPTGELKAVADGDFDFNQAVLLKERLVNLSDESLVATKSFDHCYVIKPDIENIAAVLSSNEVSLTIRTDQPGIQFCTASFLSGDFKPFQGVCLEAQNYPDAINNPDFPSALLKAGEHYHKLVSYQFTAK